MIKVYQSIIKVLDSSYLYQSIYIIVLRRYYSWVYFYVMVKSRKFVKIGSRLLVSPAYLILPDVPTTPPPPPAY